MTLLTIVQEAAGLLGLSEPVAVLSATDVTTRRLYRLANQAARELSKYHDWQALIVDREYTSVAQEEQTNALPPNDYGRLVYNPEIWDRSRNQRIIGPAPQRYWQALRNSAIGVSATGCWRILGGQLAILPIMPAGNTLSFEYISKRWARSAGGAEQESFLADTDTAIIPEDLIVLEIIWRFQQARGFSQYAESMATCEREKEKAASADRGTGRIRVESYYDSGEAPGIPHWDGVIGG